MPEPSPRAFPLTFRRDGERLVSISDGEADPMVYEGLGHEGDPSFYVPRVDAEIAFRPDPAGVVTSLILHQNGRDTPGVHYGLWRLADPRSPGDGLSRSIVLTMAAVLLLSIRGGGALLSDASPCSQAARIPQGQP